MGKEPDSAPFDYHSQSTLVRKMKSFGVDAEWIPGEERRHRLKMNAMKPSGNHTSVASVAGRRRRSAESARAAGPRRWVGPRGGCALRGVRTGANGLRHPPSQSHHPGRKRRLALCESVLGRGRGPAHGHAPALGPARAQKATHRRHRRNLTCHLHGQASDPPRALWSVAYCRLRPLRQASARPAAHVLRRRTAPPARS